jgi:hypothetical protein
MLDMLGPADDGCPHIDCMIGAIHMHQYRPALNTLNELCAQMYNCGMGSEIVHDCSSNCKLQLGRWQPPALRTLRKVAAAASLASLSLLSYGITVAGTHAISNAQAGTPTTIRCRSEQAKRVSRPTKRGYGVCSSQLQRACVPAISRTHGPTHGRQR